MAPSVKSECSWRAFNFQQSVLRSHKERQYVFNKAGALQNLDSAVAAFAKTRAFVRSSTLWRAWLRCLKRPLLPAWNWAQFERQALSE
jgi:hypothetical protein